MFERLIERAERSAKRRSALRSERIAERLREELPAARVESDGDGVRLSGRVSGGALRWAILGAMR